MPNIEIYVAGPLFTPGERQYLETVDALCRKCGYSTYLPHRDGGLASADGCDAEEFFMTDLRRLRECLAVVAIVGGADTDAGTAWECGFAYAHGRPIIGLLEDSRVITPAQFLNLMISSSAQIVQSIEALEATLLAMRT